MSRRFERIVLLVVAVTMVGGLSGCGKENEECQAQTQCGTSIQTCCSSSACHYTVNGRTFNCNGTNCDSAAVQAVNAACGRGDLADPAAVSSLIRSAVSASTAACQIAP